MKKELETLETNVCNKDGTDTIYGGMYGEQQKKVKCIHGYRIVVLAPSQEATNSNRIEVRKNG